MFPRSGYLFAALFAVAIFAFWPSYFARLPTGGTTYMHVHVVVMALWMSLLVGQPLLIRARRYGLHRGVGRSAYVLAPLAVVTALLLAHSRVAALSAEEFAAAASFQYLPFAAAGLFALTATLALVYRRAPLLHARYMVCTGLTLIDPVVARILGFRFPPLENELHYALIGFAITDAVLVALILADARSARGRAVFAIMLVVFASVHLGYFTFAQTETWLGFAGWFRALPLT